MSSYADALREVPTLPTKPITGCWDVGPGCFKDQLIPSQVPIIPTAVGFGRVEMGWIGFNGMVLAWCFMGFCWDLMEFYGVSIRVFMAVAILGIIVERPNISACWFCILIQRERNRGKTVTGPTKQDAGMWYSGWWFGTFFVFLSIGNVIIPIDFHIFQRGRYTTKHIHRLSIDYP